MQPRRAMVMWKIRLLEAGISAQGKLRGGQELSTRSCSFPNTSLVSHYVWS